VLIPTACPICGATGPAPCPGCAALLRRAPALPTPPGLDGCSALLAYDGAGRELVARFKYRNARSSARFLAGGMAALVAGEQVDVVTWAPTTPARLRARGFDQAEVLARAVARRLGLPCRSLLRRNPGPAQTGRDAVARYAGPGFAARRGLSGARILLVDDVVTTGATVAGAADALRRAGAAGVHVVAAARTPPGRRHVQSAMADNGGEPWK
jgi:predicted amidophosphoribosyltransferase